MKPVAIKSKWKCVCGLCSSIYTVIAVYDYGEIAVVNERGTESTIDETEFFNRFEPILNGVQAMIQAIE
jgi:hypothetical protein